MALALNAGESYVINNVSPGETPAVNVITNPHALVVHNEEPGKVVLLGAEAGEWTVAVKTTDGSTVKYDVTVKSVANINDINHPGTSSGGNRGHAARATGTAAPVVAKMDPGTGPVASSSSLVDFVIGFFATGHTTTTETVAAASSSAPAPSAAAPAPVATPPAADQSLEL